MRHWLRSSRVLVVSWLVAVLIALLTAATVMAGGDGPPLPH